MKPGDKVTYITDQEVLMHGVVKALNIQNWPWVVFNCNKQWTKYKEYTGQLVNPDKLKKGWI